MSKIRTYKYKPYYKTSVPGIYSEPSVRHRNFSPRVKWCDSNMKRLNRKELGGNNANL